MKRNGVDRAGMSGQRKAVRAVGYVEQLQHAGIAAGGKQSIVEAKRQRSHLAGLPFHRHGRLSIGGVENAHVFIDPAGGNQIVGRDSDRIDDVRVPRQSFRSNRWELPDFDQAVRLRQRQAVDCSVYMRAIRPYLHGHRCGFAFCRRRGSTGESRRRHRPLANWLLSLRCAVL